MTNIKPAGSLIGSQTTQGAADGADFSALAAEVSRGRPANAGTRSGTTSSAQTNRNVLSKGTIDRNVYSDPMAGQPDNGRCDAGETRSDSGRPLPNQAQAQAKSQNMAHSPAAQQRQPAADERRSATQSGKGQLGQQEAARANQEGAHAAGDDYNNSGASDGADGPGGFGGLPGKKGRGRVRTSRGSVRQEGYDLSSTMRRDERKPGKDHKQIKREATVKKPKKLDAKPVKLKVFEALLHKIIKRDFSQFLAAAPSSGLFAAGARPFSTDANRGDPLDAMPPSAKSNLWGGH